MARSSLTYRCSRRNAAKKRRAWQGGTIRERMDDAQYLAPVQPKNFVAMQPVYYKKYSKTSKKVYRGGNYPGSIRRLLALFKPRNAIGDAFLSSGSRMAVDIFSLPGAKEDQA